MGSWVGYAHQAFDGICVKIEIAESKQHPHRKAIASGCMYNCMYSALFQAINIHAKYEWPIMIPFIAVSGICWLILHMIYFAMQVT